MYSPNTVSLVGRRIMGSASSSPPPWVTVQNSWLKPSTCAASRDMYDSGMSAGK